MLELNKKQWRLFEYIEALKITINKLYINRCIFPQKDAVLTLTFYLKI